MSLPAVKVLPSQSTPSVRLSAIQRESLKDLREALNRSELQWINVDCVTGTKLEDAVEIARSDRYGLPVGTYLCPKSGLLWTSPVFDAPSQARFYRDYYRALYLGEAKATETFFQEQSIHGEEIMAYVAGHVSTVFDIGCGAGGTLVPFQRAGATCYGCDFGVEYLVRGKQAGLTMLEGDASSLRQFPPAQLVIASHVLEHTLDPAATLQQWASLVANDGYLYIEVPGTLRAFDNYRNFRRFLHVAHTYHFTLTNLRALVEPLGFEFLKGDEEIKALWVKTGRVSSVETSGEAIKVLQYLRNHQGIAEPLIQSVRRPILKLKRRLNLP